MGRHIVEFTWNLTVKKPHWITFTRTGGWVWDTLEVELDGNTVMSRLVSASPGQHQFSIDDQTVEIRWRYGTWSGDPESVVLIYSNRIVARYGDSSAVEPPGYPEDIEPGNLIPLIKSDLTSSNNTIATPPEPRHVVDIAETSRVAEPIGEEHREIDNSNSSSHVERTLTVSREWTQNYIIEEEGTQSNIVELGLKAVDLVNLKISAENSLRQKYSIARQERRTYSEQVKITVPARTRVQVSFRWKQVWQQGIITISDSRTGSEAQFPYRVRLEPTFDQRQVDIHM